MQTSLRNETRQSLSTTLGSRQLLGLHFLSCSLPELRAEVLAEVAKNPVIEDTDHPLEKPISDVMRDRDRETAGEDDSWPTDGFTALERRDDEEAVERRQALFDRQVEHETLQRHLSLQLPLSDVSPSDYPLAEALIGELDENGYFRGSTADLCMVFGCDLAHLKKVLSLIRELDPPGCGAQTLGECLEAQLDKVKDAKLRCEVAKLISRLDDVAAGRIDGEKSAEAVEALRRLDPHPGRAFDSERNRSEYVNPEVHAVRDETGRWLARTDRRSLPSVRISSRFRDLLTDPGQSEETKAYIRERIARAKEIQKAIRDRQETIESIAQAIFDRQQAFFADGFRALRPMTEVEIAKEVGVAATTVSRTVVDKYASTPQGTVELRRFFTSAVKAADGSLVSQESVLGRLRELIEAEDPSAPLSDAKLSAALTAAGYPVAVRTVAKYRNRLGFRDAAHRRG